MGGIKMETKDEKTKDEIAKQLLKKHPYADDVEVVLIGVNNLYFSGGDILLATVNFYEDEPIHYVVLPYSNECLDYFKFEFSERVVEKVCVEG
jgi:hypothetical protein